MKHTSTVLLLLAGALFGGGCRQQTQEATLRPAAQPVSTPGESQNPADRGSIRVTDASDRLLFRLKADEKGYKVFGEADQLVARLKVESDRVKAEDAAGKPLLKLKQKDNKCKAEDEAGNVLFTVKGRPDGDYKLEDAAGTLLYRIKKEDYGYKVTDARDQTLFKMKLASDRVIADGPDGKKRMEVKGSQIALAASAVALESFDLARRAALYAYLAHFEAKAQ